MTGDSEWIVRSRGSRRSPRRDRARQRCARLVVAMLETTLALMMIIVVIAVLDVLLY